MILYSVQCIALHWTDNTATITGTGTGNTSIVM